MGTGGGRAWRRQPGVFVGACIAMAGASTAIGLASVIIFTLFWRLPELREPRALWQVVSVDEGGSAGTHVTRRPVSWPDARDLGDLPDVLSIGAFTTARVSLKAPSRRVRVGFASPGFFTTVPLALSAGRYPTETDFAASGGSASALITESLAKESFGAATSAIGRSIVLGGSAFVVNGVVRDAASNFGLQGPVTVWVSLSWAPILVPGDDVRALRDARVMSAFVRFRDDLSSEAVEAVVRRSGDDLTRRYPDSHTGLRFTAVRWRGLLLATDVSAADLYRRMLLMVIGVSTLAVLSIAMLAGLFVSRLVERRLELAVRRVLGAPRRELIAVLLKDVRPVLLGSALLAVALWVAIPEARDRTPLADIPLGAVSTWLLAGVASWALVAIAPVTLAVLAVPFDVDGGALSRRLSVDVRGLGIQRALVAVTSGIATCAVAMLAVMSVRYAALTSEDVGFDPTRVLVANLRLENEIITTAGGRARISAVVRHAKALAASSVAYAVTAPMDAMGLRRRVRIDGKTGNAGDLIPFSLVSPEYFDVLGVKPVMGRVFTAADTIAFDLPVVVNRAFGMKFWSTSDVVGKKLFLAHGDDAATIVGVVPDAVYGALGERLDPHFFIPVFALTPGDGVFLARGSIDTPMGRALARELVASDPIQFPAGHLESVVSRYDVQLRPLRVVLGVVTGIAALSLLLTGIGLYAILGTLLRQRAREMAIRTVCGADPRALLPVMIRHGLRLVGGGALVGLVLALLAARLPLVGGQQTSLGGLVLSVGGGALLLSAVAIMASLPVARRVLRLSPMEVLRDL